MSNRSVGRRPAAPPYQPDGFRIYRTQHGFDMDGQTRQEFQQSFRGHVFKPMGSSCLELLRKSETIDYQRRGRSHMPLAKLTRMVMWNGPGSMRRTLSLSPTRIEYGQEPGSMASFVRLLLDDKDGILENEREKSVVTLSRLTGANIPLPDFVPAVELVSVSNSHVQTQDALEFLVPMIPDQIRLNLAEPDPFPRGGIGRPFQRRR